MRGPHNQRGLSYVEVMVAMVLSAISLVPALDALEAGLTGTGVYADVTSTHYAETSLMEEVLAEPFASLLTAAVSSGTIVPSSYSDPPANPRRRLVFLSRYDATDTVGDGIPFSVPDPDSDGDGNPFTGYDGTLWLRVVTQGGAGGIETMTTT
mgnify:CR=1 FL=1